jgi:hypothetical protein
MQATTRATAAPRSRVTMPIATCVIIHDSQSWGMAALVMCIHAQWRLHGGAHRRGAQDVASALIPCIDSARLRRSTR